MSRTWLLATAVAITWTSRAAADQKKSAASDSLAATWQLTSVELNAPQGFRVPAGLWTTARRMET